MPDLISMAQYIIDWALERGVRRTARIGAYLEEIQKACLELVESEDPTSDKVTLRHEQLKVIYEQVSERFPRSLIDREGWNLYRGLSSARIYYWLRLIDTAIETNQLESLLKDRRAISSTSFDALIRMLPDTSTNFDPESLSEIRYICLRDIARILEMQPFS